jgi:dTDP-4-amino-4,6-dideoxygalactose transaminase
MIPIARPLVGEEEKRKVLEVLDSGFITQGKVTVEFEEKFAAFAGTKHAVAASSGTTALHLALLALGIGTGDKVLTTPFTFIASSNSILYCGARPVFCDIDEQTFNLSPDAARLALEKDPSIKAILLVHIFGLPCDMDAFRSLAREFGALLIEDCAQAHGASFKGEPAGSMGQAGCFSFYPTKNMTTGEGGAVTTNSDETYRTLRLYREHGASREYEHDLLGYNFRMTNIEAAIGLCQLVKLPEFNRRRRENALFYLERLSANSALVLPVEPPGYTHAWHQFTIRVPKRDKLIEILKKEEIGCKVFYPKPIHRQPLYQSLGYGSEDLPVCEKVAEEVISIPVHPGLSGEDLERIVRILLEYR